MARMVHAIPGPVLTETPDVFAEPPKIAVSTNSRATALRIFTLDSFDRQPNWGYWLSGIATLVVFVYLVVALFKPERSAGAARSLPRLRVARCSTRP
jgi:K+-transporting ATPase KdpF subunit